MVLNLCLFLIAALMMVPGDVSSSDGAGTPSAAQEPPVNVFELMAQPFPEDEQVQVLVLARTDEISLQLVRIRAAVKAHYHKHHTETVTMLEGEGIFRIGEDTLEARVGGVFVVPAGVVHSFTVTGSSPVSVMTSFSPGFDGKDRIFVPGP